ncbi:LysM peptidoglycan-binding domain-containing protein, partial [Methylophaga sp.]|uniref:LysM peptidoglycan-binding domain-containing protein n=1 Tax=Methylophaga sp. TaxID=2024840 RepID=UPI003F698A74
MLILTLTACGGGGRAVAPVGSYDDRRQVSTAPAIYKVQRGDTLYSISWRYGMDYKEVARINGIRSPYTIYVGQKLKFRGRPKTSTRTAATKPVTPAPSPQPATKPSTSTVKKAPAPAPSKNTQAFSGSQNLQWRWPTDGKILSTYSNSSPGRKGIDISGRP